MSAICVVATVHDIGKVAVPDAILRKPDGLDAAEYEIVKRHPIVGAEILDSVQFPYPVAPIVRAHHEKWDGTGYPRGLKGEAIPFLARILAVADSYDAMSTSRPYRAALPCAVGEKTLAEGAGDPV